MTAARHADLLVLLHAFGDRPSVRRSSLMKDLSRGHPVARLQARPQASAPNFQVAHAAECIAGVFDKRREDHPTSPLPPAAIEVPQFPKIAGAANLSTGRSGAAPPSSASGTRWGRRTSPILRPAFFVERARFPGAAPLLRFL